jgi:hypothetical protein
MMYNLYQHMIVDEGFSNLVLPDLQLNLPQPSPPPKPIGLSGLKFNFPQPTTLPKPIKFKVPLPMLDIPTTAPQETITTAPSSSGGGGGGAMPEESGEEEIEQPKRTNLLIPVLIGVGVLYFIMRKKS